MRRPRGETQRRRGDAAVGGGAGAGSEAALDAEHPPYRSEDEMDKGQTTSRGSEKLIPRLSSISNKNVIFFCKFF